MFLAEARPKIAAELAMTDENRLFIPAVGLGDTPVRRMR